MLKVGIVGMGIRGNLFAQTLRDNPFARVAAIADINSSALYSSAEKFKCSAYKDYVEMLDKETPDALLITLPDFLHKAPVIEAAKRNINIMVEKPFATNNEDAEEMYAEIGKSGIKCLVAFENRWNPPFVAVKQVIENGELGTIQAMNVRLNDTIEVPVKMLPWLKNSSPAWFLQSHMVDMAGWLSGKKVKIVYAAGSKRVLKSMGIDTYDTIQAILTYEDNTSATFSSSWILPESSPTVFDGKFEIIGDKGSSYVDLIAAMTSKITNRYSVTVTLVSDVHGKLSGAPCSMVNSFIDNIRLNTEPLVKLEDGIENTKIIAAIHRSIETGSCINIR